jgi:hypothetical protein
MGLEIAKAMVDQFMPKVGPGQFTWHRFAQWLVETRPDIAAEALAEALSPRKGKL